MKRYCALCGAPITGTIYIAHKRPKRRIRKRYMVVCFNCYEEYASPYRARGNHIIVGEFKRPD